MMEDDTEWYLGEREIKQKMLEEDVRFTERLAIALRRELGDLIERKDNLPKLKKKTDPDEKHDFLKPEIVEELVLLMRKEAYREIYLLLTRLENLSFEAKELLSSYFRQTIGDLTKSHIKLRFDYTDWVAYFLMMWTKTQ